MKTLLTAATTGALVLGLGAPLHAATQKFVANVTELNGSGVSGRVDFAVIDDALLRVSASIKGLAPNLPHVNHIHGRFNDDGSAADSKFPGNNGSEADLIAAGFDADGDGLAEVLEAAPAYGDVLLSLENPAPTPSLNHQGPFADENGEVNYVIEFALDDPDPTDIMDDPFFSTVLGTDYTVADLFPLTKREYVIHGAFVDADTLNDGFAFVPGTERADGTGYSATLPVGIAEISAVPLPAGAVLLLTGLGGLGVARRFRKRA